MFVPKVWFFKSNGYNSTWYHMSFVFLAISGCFIINIHLHHMLQLHLSTELHPINVWLFISLVPTLTIVIVLLFRAFPHGSSQFTIVLLFLAWFPHGSFQLPIGTPQIEKTLNHSV